MTICKSTVVVLTMSMMAFPYAVLAIGNLQGEDRQKDSTTAERAGKTESELLKKQMDSAHALKHLEDVEVDTLTDNDLRSAIKILAAQVRHLNERVGRLESPMPRIHPAKSLESQKLRLDMGYKRLVLIDQELQRTLRAVRDLEQEARAAQSELDLKKTEANRLKDQYDKLVAELEKTGRLVEESERRE